MASRAELEAQAAAQSAVVATAWSQFQTGWAGLGLTAAALGTGAAVTAVQDLLADIVSAWGEVAGTLAADFYDDLREQADPGGTFEAVIPDPLNRAQVDGVVRWAVTPPRDAGQPDLTAQLAKIEGPLQRMVRQAQRDAFLESGLRDPSPYRVRFARVPTGDSTCAFCLLTASRGYVYRSATSAGRLNSYHDFCDCEQDVTWFPNPTPPEGYDPGELYGKYEQAREAADGSSLRAILKQLRLQEGIR